MCCGEECFKMGFCFEHDAVASLLLAQETQLVGRCGQSTLSCIRSCGVVKRLWCCPVNASNSGLDGEEREVKIEPLALSQEDQCVCLCRRGERKGDFFLQVSVNSCPLGHSVKFFFYIIKS